MWRWLELSLLFLVFASVAGSVEGADKMRVYIGTYTGGESQGIYASELDLKTGKLSPPELAAEVDNPTFLAIAPGGQQLYAAGEIGNFRGKKAGAVSAFEINKADGKLTLLNQESSQGAGPCFVCVDHTGQCVLVANYGGGSIASLPIEKGGKLAPAASSIQHEGSSIDKSRQAAPHAHSINVDPTNKYALAADLGLDKILIYDLDPKAATLKPHDPAFAATVPGGGPRHLAFHPDGKFAFVCNEMLSSVTSFAYDAKQGQLTLLETLSTLPQDYNKPGNSTAEVLVHPNGKFVYVSNRGHNSIAIFAFDAATGKLQALGHQSTNGKTPRNFGIDPTGQYLLACNQDSHTVQVFRIDPATGELVATGDSITVPMPVCVKFLAHE
jgi:6-phosphogluconolactonase